MPKKIVIIFFIVLFMVLAFRLTLILAQKYEREGEFVDKDYLLVIEEKIDKVLSLIQEKGNREKFNQEINAKLDRLLTNQEKILNELEVVKVRATKR